MQLDMLLVNLRMEAIFLKENFNIKWVAQMGLVENIETVLKEYKQHRGLLVISSYILIMCTPVSLKEKYLCLFN